MFFGGCGSERYGLPAIQNLVYPVIGTQDITTLDPAFSPDLVSLQAIELVYSGLVSLDPRTMQVIPDIATSWDVSNGGKTYTFHLRRAVRFSNGQVPHSESQGLAEAGSLQAWT